MLLCFIVMAWTTVIKVSHDFPFMTSHNVMGMHQAMILQNTYITNKPFCLFNHHQTHSVS